MKQGVGKRVLVAQGEAKWNIVKKKIVKDVFRAYDIRGVIDEKFDEHAFYTIGKAVSLRLEELQRKEIFLACDGRLTSPSLAAALKAGLLDSGIDVIDLGAVPTPVMYYAIHTKGIDSGLMVTGSHNPSNYNGIKLVLVGKTLVQSDMDILYSFVQNQNFRKGTGKSSTLSVVDSYQARVTESLNLQRPLKVVVDCGNGISGNIVPAVLKQLGCEVIPLYCEIDGTFPNHHPDPTEEKNLVDLKKLVLETQADLGLAFDGDGDRLGVVTNKAQVIWPDRLIMYYSRDILKRLPGEPIVFDVKCSSLLAKEIEKAGGVPKMCPTGHSIVKSIMKSTNAPLAGEMSGHLFFKDGWYGFDDALYSACRLLQLVSQSHLSISQQFDSIPDSINTPEIKIPVSEDMKFSIMQQFLDNADFSDAVMLRIDGLRVEFDQGFGLLRASNTTPCLVARFEAKDIESLETIKQRFKSELLKVDKTIAVPF